MTLQDFDLSPEPVRSRSIADMGESELLELRSQIDRRLKLELSNLDLAEELSLQFKQAKILLNDILEDSEVPSNQKSSVLNSATTILATIAKAQEQIYSAERLKRLEAATIKALKTLPKEAQEAFFDLYEGYLNETR